MQCKQTKKSIFLLLLTTNKLIKWQISFEIIITSEKSSGSCFMSILPIFAGAPSVSWIPENYHIVLPINFSLESAIDGKFNIKIKIK